MLELHEDRSGEEQVIGSISCINGCLRVRFCRGLCQSCWRKLSGRVSQGTVTWQQLERLGKCLPAKNKSEWLWKGYKRPKVG